MLHTLEFDCFLMSKVIFDPPEKRLLLREAIRDELTKATPEDGNTRLSPSDREAFCDDRALGRYLRATNGNVENAKKLLMRTLTWRGTIRGMHGSHPFSVSEFTQEIDKGDIYISSLDSEGRAVIVIRGSMLGSTDKLDTDKVLRHLTFILESACRLMVDQEQWVCIIDLHGFMSQAPLSFSLELLRTLTDFYTERLYSAIIVDAPSLFSFLWASISPFLEEGTKRKINFITSREWRKRSVARHVSIQEGLEEDADPSIMGGSPQSEIKRPSSFWSSLSLTRSRSESMLQEASKHDRITQYFDHYDRDYDEEAHRSLLESLGWRP